MSLERRTLASRGTFWAKWLAKTLANSGVSPNAVSIMSVVFSIAGFLLFSHASSLREDSNALSRFIFGTDNTWRWYVLAGAACIQLRLLCNLMDGMIAIEYNKKSIFGDLYNDIPDRIADVFLTMGCALVAVGPHRLDLGWFCALIAVGTAYIRTLAGAVGAQPKYLGPMAKQHRGAALTLGCIALAIYPDLIRGHNVMDFALAIVAVGSIVTCIRRVQSIVRDLKLKAGQA